MLLVIEDNEDDSFLLTRELARAGLEHEVKVIGDGLDAFEYLQTTSVIPVVVFLDLRLPRLSGIELLRRIRQEPKLRDLTVIVMTGSVDPDDVSACSNLGVRAYLPKPIGLATFKKIIGLIATRSPEKSRNQRNRSNYNALQNLVLYTYGHPAHSSIRVCCCH